MCIVCKNMKPKDELLRITKIKDGSYSLDEKAQGRGAYICKDNDCFNKCMKKKLLNKSFKMNVPDEVYNTILEDYEKIKQD